MKKILLLIALILNIGSLKPSLAGLKYSLKTILNEDDSILTFARFLTMAFRKFDGKTQSEGMTYLDNVKSWWNNENNWFTDLFPVEDSISRKAAISLTKAVRAVWFTPKTIISFADNLRKIFFNHSQTFNDFFYKTEIMSLKTLFSSVAQKEYQVKQAFKIVNEVESKRLNTVSIEDIKRVFSARTDSDALSDLKDALFPKKIMIFQQEEVLNGKESTALKILKVAKNVFKKIFGQLDPFEKIYKGNLLLNKDLINRLKNDLNEIFNRFDPKLKLAFFKRLSTKNQKILLAKIRNIVSVDDVQGVDIKDYLTELKVAVQPAETGARQPLLSNQAGEPEDDILGEITGGIPEVITGGITGGYQDEEIPV